MKQITLRAKQKNSERSLVFIRSSYSNNSENKVGELRYQDVYIILYIIT